VALEPTAVELVREALALDHLPVMAERRFDDFLKAVAICVWALWLSEGNYTPTRRR